MTNTDTIQIINPISFPSVISVFKSYMDQIRLTALRTNLLRYEKSPGASYMIMLEEDQHMEESRKILSQEECETVSGGGPTQ